MKSTIPVINCLRGVAATMVCFYHFVSTTKNYVDTQWVKGLFSYGQMGVHMFFVISGVVIPLSMIKAGYSVNDWGKFMMKRLARIEPPFIAATVLAILYFQVRRLVPGSSEVDIMPSATDLLLHLGYLVPFVNGTWAVPAFWTLAIEFHYYLILSLLLPAAMNGNARTRVMFYVPFLAGPFLSTNNQFLPLYAPLFLLGILYAFSITNVIKAKEYFTVSLLAIFISFSFLQLYETIGGVLTIVIIRRFPHYKTSILLFLGQISYSLYLLHQITGGALVNTLSHTLRETWQKPIVIIVGYMFSVLVAYLFYKLVELPSIKWSKNIKYGERRKVQSAGRS